MDNIKCIEELCKGLGEVKGYRVNHDFFGNIELEIETPHKTTLKIISDRGVFSCYVVKRAFLHNQSVPMDRIIDCNKDNAFDSLEEAIDYLKEHLDMVE